MHDHIKPSLVSPVTLIRLYLCDINILFNRKESIYIQIVYLPPTSVIIQSGIARLTMAKTSAARNSVPDITVNLSIFTLNKYSLNCRVCDEAASRADVFVAVFLQYCLSRNKNIYAVSKRQHCIDYCSIKQQNCK